MKHIIRRHAVAAFIWMTALLVALYFFLKIFGYWYDHWSGYVASQYVSDGVCNVAVIPVQGEIYSYPDPYTDSEVAPYASVDPGMVRGYLKRIEEDDYIKGILVRVDSPGGYPAGSEAIMRALKDNELPTVALVGDVAASGGYLVATGADTIIASPFSDIGSIGVTMSYLEHTKRNEYEGLEYVELSSAPYKDMLNPDRSLTEDERTLLERDLKMYHETFVNLVSENRQLPLESVQEVADGSSMPAPLALEAGLIDALGGDIEARTWFAEKLNLTPEEVVFCEW